MELTLILGVVAGVFAGLWWSNCAALRGCRRELGGLMARNERLQQNHDRQIRVTQDQALRHVIQLIQDFAKERELLLNRIQAPIAAVGASFAMGDERGDLAPPTPGHGFDDAPVGEPDASSADSARAIREARAAEIDSQLAQRGIVQAE